MKQQVKITILTENTAGGKLLAEHGLSYLIEHENRHILFDTGHTDVFLKNSEQLGIKLNTVVDTIVLSHGHWDHGNGLNFLTNKNLVAHPGVFTQRFRKTGSGNIGLKTSKTEAEKKFNLLLSEKPAELHKNFYFLGVIPRKTSFESQNTPFVLKNGADDFVMDDSALTIVVNNELIIISGCAHAGICNIINHAIKITGVQSIKAVMGGFHLKHSNKQTHETIAFFKKHKIKQVFPSHCTELPALAAFYNAFETKQLKTGNELIF